MQDCHELFSIKRGDKRLTVSVLKTSRHRTYVGSIDGQVCAMSFGKGDLLRMLIEIAAPLPYFVMYSPLKREAKVHKGTCRNCRQGLGRKDGVSRNQWYAFATRRRSACRPRCGPRRRGRAHSAYARAVAPGCASSPLAPTDYSACAMCIKGHYVRHRVKSR